MGGRGHDRQLLFPVTGHEDAAHGHRLRHLDGYRRPGRRHRGHSDFSGARHRPAAYFRGAAARRYRRAEAHRITAKKTAFAVFFGLFSIPFAIHLQSLFCILVCTEYFYIIH